MSFTLIDIVFVLAGLLLIALIFVAESGAMSNLRRPIAATMLSLAASFGYLLIDSDTKGSFFFGAFADEEDEMQA